MKRLTTLTIVLLTILSLLLTGCGGASKSARAVPQEGMSMESPAADAAPNEILVESGSGSTTTLPENRKWIVTVDMDAETEDLDALLAGLDESIASLEGYMEDQNIFNGSSYSSSTRRRYANLTIRIPAGDVDAFTAQVAGIANVVSKTTNREDITLTYTATESKITALKTEETRLLELLAAAETMSDLLEIEARLSDVRYELERYSSQLRLYDNQVDYATIFLRIEEVREYTPVEEKTVWEEIRDGFSRNLKNLGEDIVDFLVWVLVSSPYLVIWGIIITVIVLIAKKKSLLPKALRKKKAAKSEKTDPPQKPQS